jgi:hypothetical protein
MVIVENSHDVSHIAEKLQKYKSYWYPVWSDTTRHYMNNMVSFVFIRCDDTDFIYPLDHVDCISGNMKELKTLWNTATTKWVWDKKSWLSVIDDSNCNDIMSYCFINNYSTNHETFFKQYHEFMYKIGYREHINKYISIFELGDAIQKIFNSINFNLSIDHKTFDWFNMKYIPLLAKIEKTGIHVNQSIFNKKWIYNDNDIVDDKVYTKYNPFTLTGRPSNTHNGVNYAALSKSDGSRDAFISNGIFLQLDYDAYHPRIIGKLIKYDLPVTPVHKWFADLYGCDVESAKTLTFRLLYGGIYDEFAELPYFKDVKAFIDKFYDSTLYNDYIQTPNRKIPLHWVENKNPQKVFNYLLQAIETEINIDKMWKIFEIIDNTDIKLVLYTYDSFLFDVPSNVDKAKLAELKTVLECNGFPVKAKWGYKYSDL